jgi:predicted aspartyl protease
MTTVQRALQAVAITVLLVAASGVLSARLASNAGWTTTFDLSRRGEIIVSARINERAGRFLIDTGSSHSILSDEFARSVGARAVARASVTSALGEGLQTVVRIDRLDLGFYVVEGLQPTIVPARTLDESSGIDGLIGQDVLAFHHFTIDYSCRRIEWWDGIDSDPEGGSTTFAMTFEDGRFLIDIPQRRGALRLVPDSGAQRVVLFSDATWPADLTLSSEPLQASALVGAVPARSGRLAELRVGVLRLPDVPVAIVERPAHAQALIGGLLPLSLFRRVSFDGPRRRLTIDGR